MVLPAQAYCKHCNHTQQIYLWLRFWFFNGPVAQLRYPLEIVKRELSRSTLSVRTRLDFLMWF